MAGRDVQIIYAVVSMPEGFTVQRNGKSLITPLGDALVVTSAALAEAIADEWRAQKDKINPSSMPMMQLAATTLDMTRKNRCAVVDQVSAYAKADLLCFRAQHPPELIQRQQQTWQPVLDWGALRFDALLKTGQGIMPINQSPEALRALRSAVEVYDDFGLTGVKQAAEVSGSLLLGLALAEKHLTAEQVFHAAELETHFQAEKWGEDPDATQRHESIRADLAACAKWFELLH